MVTCEVVSTAHLESGKGLYGSIGCDCIARYRWHDEPLLYDQVSKAFRVSRLTDRRVGMGDAHLEEEDSHGLWIMLTFLDMY